MKNQKRISLYIDEEDYRKIALASKMNKRSVNRYISKTATDAAKYDLDNVNIEREVGVGAVVDVVGKLFYVTPQEIFSESRAERIVNARHLVFYLCCKYTHHSLKEIGKRLGGKDHSTVIHGRDKYTQATDCDFANFRNPQLYRTRFVQAHRYLDKIFNVQRDRGVYYDLIK